MEKDIQSHTPRGSRHHLYSTEEIKYQVAAWRQHNHLVYQHLSSSSLLSTCMRHQQCRLHCSWFLARNQPLRVANFLLHPGRQSLMESNHLAVIYSGPPPLFFFWKRSITEIILSRPFSSSSLAVSRVSLSHWRRGRFRNKLQTKLHFDKFGFLRWIDVQQQKRSFTATTSTKRQCIQQLASLWELNSTASHSLLAKKGEPAFNYFVVLKIEM